jgi:hypothetical protein
MSIPVKFYLADALRPCLGLGMGRGRNAGYPAPPAKIRT